MHVTFFDGDQTNCFPSATHDFTWEGLEASYRVAGEGAPGCAKASRGYAIFAQLRPATANTLAAIQTRRRARGFPEWSPSVDQQAAAMRYGYRDKAHLVESTALICDYDGNPTVPPDWTAASWPGALLAHSTHSYHPVESPGRWRVILQLTEPIPADEYDAVRKAVQPLLPPGCIIRAAHQPAFLPTCPDGRVVEYATLDGEGLDWRALLPKPAPPTPAVVRTLIEGANAVMMLAEIWPTPGGGNCHTAGLALGGVLAGSGWSESEALAFADEVFAAAGIEGDNLPAAAHSSFVTKRAGGKAWGWPKLRECMEGDATAAFAALETLIRSTNLVQGDDADLANSILRGQLKGAVYDEGAVWLQNDTGLWEEVPPTRIAVWVMEYSGVEYLGEPNEDGKRQKKMVSIGAGRCHSVEFLIGAKLADATGPGFFAGRMPGVAFENGLLRLDGNGVAPLETARVRRTLPMKYPPVGPSEVWDGFMDSVWGADREAIACLEEVLGYLLSGRTDLQKAFVFVGARRAGKSLILRLLARLLGDAVCAASIHELGERFGLENLLGKSVAIHDDFRKSAFQGAGAATQKFLSITGEGMQTVQRKGTSNVNCQLPCRFVLSTNVSFGMADLGGAVSSRLILLYFAQGHLGSEDLGLEARLGGQLPGLVRRALAGLDRLRERGHFVEPESSAEERAASEEIESPMTAFRDEHLTLEEGEETAMTDMHKAMADWRDVNGFKKMASTGFKFILKSWGVSTKRGGARNDRTRVYRGVKLTKSTVSTVGVHGVHAVSTSLKN